MSDISQLLPDRVRGVELYDPKRPVVEFDLSDNTNQWPLADAVLEALKGAKSIEVSRYPEIYAASLKEKLSDIYREQVPGIEPSNIVVGCGTDDVLDCIVRSCTSGGEIISSPIPSFPMTKYFARFNDREINEITLESDGSVNVESLDENSKLIYLCSPNNPTGLSIPKENVKLVLERTTGFVVIDEAYGEFSENNFLELLENPRVIVTRTFSKIYGLAGLRIGYAICDPEVASAIEALRGPYKASSLGISAALTSLECKEYYDSLLAEIKSARSWLTGALLGLGLEVLESDANFVFVPGTFSPELKEKLKGKGFSVRLFLEGDIYGAQGLRITLAPKEILEQFVEVLKGEL